MCDCSSYNRPDLGGSTAPTILTTPEWFTHQPNKEIAIDACIAADIQSLWDSGIETLNSCCGHNGAFGDASVVILDAKDAPTTNNVLKQSGRVWMVQFWSGKNRREEQEQGS